MKISHDKTLLEALGIDTEPLFGEEIQIDDGEIKGDYASVLHSGSNPGNITPLIWYSKLIMSSFIDCGMHLIFHDIVAYTVVKMEGFIKDHGMSQQFEHLSNHYL